MSKSQERKSRSPNWTQLEIETLVSEYKERKEIIDGKLSPKLTSLDKMKAFQEITDAINAISKHKREVDQVKKALIDVKCKTKKKAAALRMDRMRTGGGPPSDISFTPYEEILIGLMNPQTIEGIISDGDTELSSQTSDIQSVLVTDGLYESQTEVSSVVATGGVYKEQGHNQYEIVLINESFKDNNNSTIIEEKEEIENKEIHLKKRKTENSNLLFSQREEVVDIERSKRDFAQQLVQLKKIKLKAYLKSLKNKGVDVSEEIKELAQI